MILKISKKAYQTLKIEIKLENIYVKQKNNYYEYIRIKRP